MGKLGVRYEKYTKEEAPARRESGSCTILEFLENKLALQRRQQKRAAGCRRERESARRRERRILK